ncbi:hypothetical protein BC829DRAFT_48842 [Chytridium lagenaria]|nr:hypothetical protein BC829DRAFT_48842 [Chytridium lagenaria]
MSIQKVAERDLPMPGTTLNHNQFTRTDMPNTTFIASIQSARITNIIHKQCTSCKHKSPKDLDLLCDADFYCEKCRRQRRIKGYFMLQMTLSLPSENKLMTVLAYDEIVGQLIGCDAHEYDRLSHQHPFVSRLLEQHIQMTFGVWQLRQNTRNEKEKKTKFIQDPIVESLRILTTLFVPLMELEPVKAIRLIENRKRKLEEKRKIESSKTSEKGR